MLFNQSNHLKHSNKDCDWLILACFIRVQMHADVRSVRSENEVDFENEGECGGEIKEFFIITQIKKPRLCSVLL